MWKDNNERKNQKTQCPECKTIFTMDKAIDACKCWNKFYIDWWTIPIRLRNKSSTERWDLCPYCLEKGEYINVIHKPQLV